MWDAKLLLICAAVAAAVLAAGALLARRRRGGPMIEQSRPLPKQSRPLPEMKGSFDASAGGNRVDVALGRDILHLLEAGRRDEAVALVRGRTGWGVAEADGAVARLEKLMKRLGT